MNTARRSHSLEFGHSDSSGTDDDLPPTHSGRGGRSGRMSGNGRVISNQVYGHAPTVDQMIFKLEQDAYTAVLRAFGAQSETITWAKEHLITDLRKELGVSDEQHRECLGKVSRDETVKQIQEWRKMGSMHPGLASNAPVLADPTPSPAVSQSRKKQKTAHSLPPPPPPLMLKPAAAVPSSGPPRRGAPPGPRKKHKGGRPSSAAASVMPKAPVSGSQGGGRGVMVGRGFPSGNSIDWIGRRVKTRWPADNTFYEAVITDYNAENGTHALVYDINTENETWEWVNLKEMSSEDLKWVDGPPVTVGGKVPPPGLVSVGRGGAGRGAKKGGTRGGLVSPVGRPRGPPKQNMSAGPGRPWRSVENGIDKKPLELMPLEDLVKEVDKIEEEDDLEKLENAKRAAKVHEEAIRKALAEVGESSDEGESDDGGHAPSHSTDQHRSQPGSEDHARGSDDEESGDERGSDGEHMNGEGGGASYAYDGAHGEDGDDKDEDG